MFEQLRPRLQDKFSIPELLDGVGSHLLPPDLYSSILVNKRWNAHLLPLLWQTVDDELYSWPQFLVNSNNSNRNNNSNSNSSDDDSAEDSREHMLVRTLRKYGHYIRYLRIHYPIMIEAAHLSSACTSLLSFEIFDLALYTAIRGRAETVTTLTRPNPLFLSPLFEGVFVPSPLEARSRAQDYQDRLTVQRFWLLVQQNASTLQKLRLDRSLNILARITSVDFLREMVTSLGRLTDFENQSDIVNVGDFLDRLPHLQNLITPTFYMSTRMFSTMRMAPVRLRSLNLTGQILTREFFTILGGLPELESLRVIGLNWDNVTDKDISIIMGGTPSNLRTLEYLFSGFSHIPTEKRILPWLPKLRKLVALQTVAQTVSNLAKFCPLLEEYHEWNDGVTIYPGSTMPHLNALAPLLHGCQHLRVINAIQHRMDVNELLSRPWIATNLEVFRIQIVKVPRLTADQQDRFDHAMKKDALSEPLATGELELFRIFRRSQTAQTKVLEKLSNSLPRLRVLDLGYESRQVSLASDRNPPMETVGGKQYIKYGGPIPDTLELSLEAGLRKLGRLKELEVFGFEGLNYRIGERELEWMSEEWPKLRCLRGLQVDVLRGAKPDRRREELREYMVSLRPDVVHERA